MPRPALIMTGYICSGVYLLEHVIWSHESNQPERDVDIEVFKRWMDDGGFISSVEDVKKANVNVDRVIKLNSAIVFGSKVEAKL